MIFGSQLAGPVFRKEVSVAVAREHDLNRWVQNLPTLLITPGRRFRHIPIPEVWLSWDRRRRQCNSLEYGLVTLSRQFPSTHKYLALHKFKRSCLKKMQLTTMRSVSKISKCLVNRCFLNTIKLSNSSTLLRSNQVHAALSWEGCRKAVRDEMECDPYIRTPGKRAGCVGTGSDYTFIHSLPRDR